MPIAFDTSAVGPSGGSPSITWNHTCAGSDLILFVATFTRSLPTGKVDSVTYNGVGMTEIIAGGVAYEYIYTQLWYLIAPAIGSHAIVVNVGTPGVSPVTGESCSYTGVLQSGIPDASGTNSSDSATTLTKAITTVAQGCWIVVSGGCLNIPIRAITNLTLREKDPDYQGGIFDSNTALSAGSNSSTIGGTGSADAIGMVVASFAPVSAPIVGPFPTHLNS